MENKKQRFWKLFKSKKSDCCSIEVEQVPEDTIQKERSCSCCHSVDKVQVVENSEN